MNPFTKFAAGSSFNLPAKAGSNGWFHANKKGTDDDAIAKCQRRVSDFRRNAREKTKTTSLKLPKNKRSRRQDSGSDDDSDNNSLNDFIVDDEDEIEFESSPSTHERKREVKVPRRERAALSRASDHSTSNNSLGRRNIEKESNIESYKIPPRKKALLYLTSDDSSDNDFPAPQTMKRSFELNSFNVPQRNKSVLDLTSSTSASSSSGSFNSPEKVKLTYGDRVNPQHDDSESENEMKFDEFDKSLDLKKNTLPLVQNVTGKSLPEEELILDDSDLSGFKPSRVTNYSKKSRFLAEDSEDECKCSVTKNNSILETSFWNEDDFVDDDEAAAIAYALRESRKMPRQLRKGTGKRIGSKKPQPQNVREQQSEIIDIDDSSTDHQIGAHFDINENKEDRDQDMDAILKAVNILSSNILSVMVKGSSDSIEGAIIPGLIVDGALALSTYENLQISPSSEMGYDRKISHDDILPVCPNLKLADYQLIGVNWLWLLHHMTCDLSSINLKGRKDLSSVHVSGILADEMGLGKTVQTIAFLALLRKCYPMSDPHLIIVPASVLSNWEREWNLLCPDMVIVKFHGTLEEREEIKERLRRSLLFRNDSSKSREKVDIVLTTFSYFSSEKSDDRSFLRKIEWNYMVVDEAHCLKNQKGARFKNMDKMNSKRRLLLTGTPIQNRAAELVALLCFLMPIFAEAGSSSGWDDNDSKDSRIVEYFRRLEASNSKGSKSKKDNEPMIKQLKQLLAPFILRRKKDDVMNQMLPPKIRTVEFVPFDECMRRTYESILESHIISKANVSITSADDVSFHKHLFTSLRKAANHPLLLRTRCTQADEISHLSKHLYLYGYFGRNESCTVKLVEKEIETFSDYDIHFAAVTLLEENPMRKSELERYVLDEDTLFLSPKFQRLKNLLPSLINDGHRILIFSQWTRCLDLLELLMSSLDIRFLRLDGSTSTSQRQGLIDTFNTDSSIPVFLLSTRAGGIGINLTAADTCILHDLDFNPFNDLQAEDRCHRIGQTKPVTVIKMITKGTVDEDIYDMQERKRSMNTAILERSKKSGDQESENEDVKHVIKAAVARFLQSGTETILGSSEDTTVDFVT